MTPKQDNFIKYYLRLGNASEAYRLSYDAGRMSRKTVNRRAKELLDHSKIAASIRQLRSQIAQDNQITFEEVVAALRHSRDGAAADGKWSAAVSASMALAKLGGLIQDRQAVSISCDTQDQSTIRALSNL